MASIFKQTNTRGSFDRLVVVYLEGPDDAQVFKERWYDDFSHSLGIDLDFKVVEGCGNVILQVQARAQDPSPIAFGLLDRDALLKEGRIDDFLEPDDEVFRQSVHFHPRIRCLQRWEMENYLLLDPDIVEAVLHDGRAPAGQRRDRDAVLASLLRHAEILLVLSAYHVALRDLYPGSKQLPLDYGRDFETVEQMIAELEARDPRARAALASFRPRVEMFRDPQADAAARWAQINRIIDGKRLLGRIVGKVRLSHDQTRNFLATRIGDRRAIPAEIRNAIEKDFMEEAARLLEPASAARESY